MTRPEGAGLCTAGPAPTMAGLPAMSWVEHLAELRRRVLVSLAAVVGGTVAGWLLAPRVLDALRRLAGAERLLFVAPAEAFLAWLRLALAIGVVGAAPVVLWQAWRFVLPGLFPHERRTLQVFLPLAAGLALAGLAFGLFVVFPVTLRLLLAAGGAWLGAMPAHAALSAGRLVSFFLATTLPFAAVFQLPVVLFVLVGWGVTTCRHLREVRRGAYLLAFVVGGVLTPNGVAFQLLMAVPLIALYEVAVWAAGRWRLEGRFAAEGPSTDAATGTGGGGAPAPGSSAGVSRTGWSTES